MVAGDGGASRLTRAQRVLISVVVFGAVIIAGIGFAGSYAAVRELALQKGFGNFSYVFPIGIDAGICVLLALDLLLTWIRIPFPLLRQTAWLLTAATIAFNGAAAWPDPLGVGMHGVIPVLFVVSVEAARHAIGRIADITADKHMEGVRLTRWLLSPVPTFLLWRRMKLWELRSYEQVIKLEQERLVYQARLRSRYGRAWRRKAPVESLMPLRLARYGVPLADTAPAGLAAAGIVDPSVQVTVDQVQMPTQRTSPELEHAGPDHELVTAGAAGADVPAAAQAAAPPARPDRPQAPTADSPPAEHDPRPVADAYGAWIAESGIEPTTAQFALWLQEQYGIATAAGEPLPDDRLEPLLQMIRQRTAAPSAPTDEDAPEAEDAPEDVPGDEDAPEDVPGDEDAPEDVPGDEDRVDEGWDDYFHSAQLAYAEEHGVYPDAAALARYVYQRDGITRADGQPVAAADVQPYIPHTTDEAHAGPGEHAEDEDPAQQETADQEVDQTPATTGAHAATQERAPRVDARVEEELLEPDETEEPALNVVDRYYLAWTEYQARHGHEPGADELSAYLADKGILGRSRKPISPSTLRRYTLQFRTYTIWAEHRLSADQPSAGAVAQDCAARGITAQYNKPVTPDQIAEQAELFERRWRALTRHHGNAQP